MENGFIQRKGKKNEEKVKSDLWKKNVRTKETKKQQENRKNIGSVSEVLYGFSQNFISLTTLRQIGSVSENYYYFENSSEKFIASNLVLASDLFF